MFNKAEDWKRYILCVLSVFLVGAFALLMISFKNLYDAYKIKAYQRFNVENLSRIDVHSKKKDSVEKALCEDYRNTIETNVKANDDKADSIQVGIKRCAIGLLILSLSAIATVIVVG